MNFSFTSEHIGLFVRCAKPSLTEARCVLPLLGPSLVSSTEARKILLHPPPPPWNICSCVPLYWAAVLTTVSTGPCRRCLWFHHSYSSCHCFASLHSVQTNWKCWWALEYLGFPKYTFFISASWTMWTEPAYYLPIIILSKCLIDRCLSVKQGDNRQKEKRNAFTKRTEKKDPGFLPYRHLSTVYVCLCRGYLWSI